MKARSRSSGSFSNCFASTPYSPRPVSDGTCGTLGENDDGAAGGDERGTPCDDDDDDDGEDEEAQAVGRVTAGQARRGVRLAGRVWRAGVVKEDGKDTGVTKDW